MKVFFYIALAAETVIKQNHARQNIYQLPSDCPDVEIPGFNTLQGHHIDIGTEACPFSCQMGNGFSPG
jgi:hypothetical protein